MPLGYGVIGSPTGSGPVSLGSSPGTPASSADQRGCTSRPRLFVSGSGGLRNPPVGLTVAEAVVCALDLGPAGFPAGTCSAPSSRGLGRRPLKAVTPVRIRSGLLLLYFFVNPPAPRRSPLVPSAPKPMDAAQPSTLRHRCRRRR